MAIERPCECEIRHGKNDGHFFTGPQGLYRRESVKHAIYDESDFFRGVYYSFGLGRCLAFEAKFSTFPFDTDHLYYQIMSSCDKYSSMKISNNYVKICSTGTNRLIMYR